MITVIEVLIVVSYIAVLIKQMFNINRNGDDRWMFTGLLIAMLLVMATEVLPRWKFFA